MEALHRAYVAAGADILLTGTFGASRPRLAPAKLAEEAPPLNRRAARLARAAARSTARPVAVAGCLGPVEDPLRVRADALEAAWTEQASALRAGGVDLLWFETLSGAAEMAAAARTAAAVGLPFVATASFPLGGRTLAGLDPVEAGRCLASLDPAPLAAGLNCGGGPGDVLRDLPGMKAGLAGLPLVAKPSAGLPRAENGRLVHPHGPADFAAFAQAAHAAGAAVVGGCCGAGPGHIAAMARSLGDRGRARV